MPQRITVLAHGLHLADAVGHDALAMAEGLRRAGRDVRVVGGVIGQGAEALAELFRPEDPAWQDRDALLILHLSWDWPAGEMLLGRTRNRVVIRFHNITPSEHFRFYDPEYAAGARRALDALGRICRRPGTEFWAASEFNRKVLIESGAPGESCRVLPPFHRVEELRTAPPAAPAAPPPADAPVILFTSGLRPHKGHLFALECFATYRERHAPAARLVFVGIATAKLARYRRMVERAIERLGLADSVLLTGRVDEPELAWWYRRAAVFLSPSRHEGFGVPLVEAMALGTPMVALARGAVPETVGDAGLLFDEEDPGLFAEALAYLGERPEERAWLGEQGRLRYEREFEKRVLAERLEAML